VRKFVKWWLPVVVWMSVIFVGSSLSDLPEVGDDTTDGFVHRAAHVLEFAVLGALLLRALSKAKPVTKREMLITLIVVTLYGVSDEVHQRFTPGRSSEGISVLFDVAGGALGAWAYRRWIMQRHARQQTEQVAARRAESTGEASADRVFD
jgi:VanZ family protein